MNRDRESSHFPTWVCILCFFSFHDFEKLPNTLGLFTIVYAESTQEILSGIKNLLHSKKDLSSLV